MFTIDEEPAEIPDYIDTIPLISQAMEFRLDRIMRGLAFAWGFPSVQCFANSIITGALPIAKLEVYNRLIRTVLDEAQA